MDQNRKPREFGDWKSGRSFVVQNRPLCTLYIASLSLWYISARNEQLMQYDLHFEPQILIACKDAYEGEELLSMSFLGVSDVHVCP